MMNAKDDDRSEAGPNTGKTDDLSRAAKGIRRATARKSGAFPKTETDSEPPVSARLSRESPPPPSVRTESAKEDNSLITVDSSRSHYMFVAPRTGKRKTKPPTSDGET